MSQQRKKTTTVKTVAVKQADKSPALSDASLEFLAWLAAKGYLSEFTDNGGDSPIEELQDAYLCDEGSLHINLAIPL